MNTIKFYLKLIYTLLAIHLSVYAVALARYEFAVFSLDAKIANLITLSEGKYGILALERIPSMKLKIPVEPKIYNIIGGIQSLLPFFDLEHPMIYEELSHLLAHNKKILKNLDLIGFKFIGTKLIKGKTFLEDSIERGADFKRSNFIKLDLSKAVLKNNLFQESNFYEVKFQFADMHNTNFAFTTFNECDLSEANLEQSNFCEASFVNTKYSATTNLQKVNFIGADLTGFDFRNNENLPRLKGAFYNSKKFDVIKDNDDGNIILFLATAFPNSFKKFNEEPESYIIHPTKFPPGFDPEAHGMIDVSKW